MAEKKNEVVIKESYALASGQEISLDKQAVMNISNNNENLTDSEIDFFIQLCKYQKLNPFTREAYIIKYDNSKPASMVVSLSAFQRIADEHPQYDGMEDGIIVQSGEKIIKREGTITYPNEKLLGGWAKVYRKDRRVPFVSEVSLKEYTTGKALWLSKAGTMINKCAKVSALRKAFPQQFNGCYSEEEMDVQEPQQVQEEKPPIEFVDADTMFNDTPAVDAVVEDEVLEELPQLDDIQEPNIPSDDGLYCSKCGIKISEKVANFSTDKFGKPLCFNCQKEM